MNKTIQQMNTIRGEGKNKLSNKVQCVWTLWHNCPRIRTCGLALVIRKFYFACSFNHWGHKLEIVWIGWSYALSINGCELWRRYSGSLPIKLHPSVHFVFCLWVFIKEYHLLEIILFTFVIINCIDCINKCLNIQSDIQYQIWTLNYNKHRSG